MKQALTLTLLTIAALEAAYLLLGYDRLAGVVYGAMSVMALLIAGTFLWLWFERTTPLAIGMALSWLGVAAMSGWWWAAALSQVPQLFAVHPGIFAALALPLVGAVLHFAVIQRSFGLHGLHFLWPVAGALVLSGLASVLR